MANLFSYFGFRRARRPQAVARRPCRPLQLEQLEDRRVLADLRLTNVFLVQRDDFITPTTPVLGELVWVRGSFQTTSLPAGASYRLEFKMDGVPLSVTRTFGAGLPSGAWFQTLGGWFATAGSHTIEVMLDADNAIAETSETNNMLTPLTFTAAAPTSLPQKFGNPMGGVLYRDWHFSNYTDVDPSTGIRDFQGYGYTYDGHDAEDIGLANFARMDTGIPVYAAADGTVESMADGNFDRNTVQAGQPANYVVINHGNGWKTKYYHFSANTITVKVGDTITAGQLLGLAGSSGNSTGAHLHWEVEHHGATVEPNFAPSEYFVSPLTYQRDAPTTIRDMGITNYIPADAEFAERPAEQTTFSTAVSQIALAWFKYSHFNVGDQFQVQWYRPDGTLNNTSTRTIAADQRGGWYYFNQASGAVMAYPGTWRVAVVMAGLELASRTFDVSTGPGAAGIKVSRGTSLIIDNRTTAWDFGTAAQSGPVASQSFTITNHGTTTLALSNPVLPPGFALSGTFPASIVQGASATLTVDLTTDRSGTKFGAIQFDTNDPDTPIFNFNITGTVSGAAPVGAPVITLPAPALAYNVLGTSQLIDPQATLTDTDTTDFGGGSLTVEFNARGSPKDALAIRNGGTLNGQIGASGTAVTYGGAALGAFSGGLNGAALVVNFTSGATLAAVRELLRNITFSTTATDPQSLARSIRFTLVDDQGNTSNQPLAVAVQNLRPTTLLLENGNLLIADSSAAGKNDDWRLSRSGQNLVLTDLSGNTIDASSLAGATGSGTSSIMVPLASIADAPIIVNGGRGNDTLTLDLSAGDPIPAGGLQFNGGDPAIDLGDKLAILGGSQGVVTYNYTNASDGSIVMSNFGSVAYTGLEPISNCGVASDIIFNLPSGPNTITLADDGTPGNTLSRLSGATFETTDFANPTGSLTINRGSAADSITLNALADFNAGLAIGTEPNPFGAITFADALALSADKSLSAYASGTISLPNAVSDLAAFGSGSISLTTTRDISLSSGSSISTVDGKITLSANQQAITASGNFAGVLVNGGTVRSTGTGNVALLGRGGNSSTGSQFGVRVVAGGVIAGGASGTASVTGTAGLNSGGSNTGVSISGAGSMITSAGADLVVNGAGGGNGAGVNRGVGVFSGGKIAAGGTGTVTVEGIGGKGVQDENQGVLVVGDSSSISSLSGLVTITGRGGGGGFGKFNGGVVTINNGFLQAGGSGALVVNGTAGNPVSVSYGISISPGTLATTDGGDITLIGTAINNSAAAVLIDGSVAGAGGNVLVVADSLRITDIGSIDAGSQAVNIRPRTPSTPIDLGGPDTGTVLGLSDAELNLITAAGIQIGDADTGDITLSADITRTTPASLTLVSGGTINFLSGSITTGGNAALVLSPGAGPAGTGANVRLGHAGIDATTGEFGTLSFEPGSDLLITIDGAAVDTQYEQMNVSGQVDLTGVDLVLSAAYSPAADDSFTIVANDGADAVIGVFNNLPELAFVNVNGVPLRITYRGGTGNDVVLIPPNLPPSFTNGPDQTGLAINDEAGAIKVEHWVTNHSPGPLDEGSQSLAFHISMPADQQALFLVLPAIDGTTGDLTFTPRPNAKGTATLSVTLSDSGGGPNDTSEEATFLIDIAKPHPWHNSSSGAFANLNVNGKDGVTLVDAVIVLSYLNSAAPAGEGKVPASAFSAPAGVPLGGYIDVAIGGLNANFISTLDALQIINYLNTPQGEGESGEVAQRDAIFAPAENSPLNVADLLSLLAEDQAAQRRRKLA